MRYRKVVLIEPRPPGYHVFSYARLPRLGLPILGAILKRRGCEVAEFCEDLSPIDWPELTGADLVGISTITSTAPASYQLSQRCRARGIPVVIGGPHVTFRPDEALQSCDYVIRGEAEETIEELMDVLEAGQLPAGVAGLSYRDGERFVHNPLRPAPSDLDRLPFPDFSLIRGHERINFVPIMTSRGCPFDCSFCSVTSMFGHKFRYRSPENVLEELGRYYGNGQSPFSRRSIFFYDDIFNANVHHLSSLLEMMVRKNITPSWSAQCHAGLVVKQKELLPLMRRSGCNVLYLGLESSNQETLDAYNKKQVVEEIIEAISLLHQYNIIVHGMLVLGADSDDIQTIRETVRFVLRHRVDTVQFLVLVPLPGTQDYQRLTSEGRLLKGIGERLELYDGHHVVFRPKQLTPYQLQVESFRAMRHFYSLRQCLRLVMTPALARAMLIALWQAVRWRLGPTRSRFVKTRPIVSVLTRVYGWLHVCRWRRANREFISSLKSQ